MRRIVDALTDFTANSVLAGTSSVLYLDDASKASHALLLRLWLLAIELFLDNGSARTNSRDGVWSKAKEHIQKCCHTYDAFAPPPLGLPDTDCSPLLQRPYLFGLRYQAPPLADAVASLEKRVSILEPGRLDSVRQKAQLAKAELDSLAKSRAASSSPSAKGASAARNKKVRCTLRWLSHTVLCV